jgi:hypothetical protein
VLQPGESLKLEPLIVDAVEEGEHACTVRALSPDAPADAPQSASTRTITIVAPVLKLTLEGSKLRYTDTDGVYTITVENIGTAPAHDVQVRAALVGDGRPYQPRGASWDRASSSFVWTIPLLEKGKPQTFSFKVRFGGLGTFNVHAQATARGGLKEIKSCSTQIEGSALLDLDVAEDLRVLDVGQQTVFKIEIKNLGTKEARKLQVHVELKNNLEAIESAGTEADAVTNPARTQVSFPEIDRLAPGNKLLLYIKVQAKAAGLGTCRVFLAHEEFGEGERLEDVAIVTIQDLGRQ